MWVRGADFYSPRTPLVASGECPSMELSLDAVEDAPRRTLAAYAAFAGLNVNPQRVSARAAMGVTPDAKPDELIVKHGSLEEFIRRRDALTSP
jgi:hypothetical protein